MENQIESKGEERVLSMREEMHKALDYRIETLKDKGFDLDNNQGRNLLSKVETEGKLLKISLMIPIESMSMEELKEYIKK